MRTSTKVMEQRLHPDVSSLWLAASGLCIVSLAKLIMVETKEAKNSPIPGLCVMFIKHFEILRSDISQIIIWGSPNPLGEL